jgi:hypothetical protein
MPVAAATLKWSKSTRDFGVDDGQRVAAASTLAATAPDNHNHPDLVSA